MTHAAPSRDSLLLGTRSSSWDERDQSVRGLAAHVDDKVVVARLVEMLLDENTAVIETVVDVLVRNLGAEGLRLTMPTFAAEDDEDFDAREHIGDQLSSLLIDGVITLDMVREIEASASTEAMRDGARELIELLDPSKRDF